MTADFLTKKPVLQRLLVSRYPVLLIDESQDTNSGLMDALLSVQRQHESIFCLGLFGDTMQRIYADGKVGLAGAIPASWARPEKRMNHRCPARIIRLINKIRTADDGQEQRGRSDKPEGCVRLFLLPEKTPDKFAAESRISKRMAEISEDHDWMSGANAVKTLTLEHHMAARRFGFEQFFEALYPVDRLRTGLLDGTLPGVTFFTRDILPLVRTMQVGDKFGTAAVVRTRSPLLDRTRIETVSNDQVALLRTIKNACDSLHALCSKEQPPSLLSVLRNVAASSLFAIPESLSPFVAPTELDVENGSDDYENVRNETDAWRRALDTTFDQIEKYDRYVRGVSEFDTHQGVKGLEFPRVMVVISDDEARGFLFSYEKLFGAKEKSRTDLENESSGRETTIDRTRRLFYVICSRAQQSLAIVYYSSRPDLVKDVAVKQGWFERFEVEMPT
jgi:DNA helicase-2/ATP-dependent DNA helicase PcrA